MAVLPEVEEFHSVEPKQAGFDSARLAEAVAFARAAETPWPRALSRGLNADPTFTEPPPWNEVLGPTRDRGGPNGLVVRGGHLVASWGDTRRVDMTFSIAKSYLSILAGVALRRGLIRDVDDAVAEYALDDGFESPQNAAITWRHFLNQTSEWEGTLWGKPDLVDRNRQVGVGADNSRKGTHRDLRAPGEHYEYNDVRVNRLSLSLLQVFRQPLPQVLKSEVMDPIGASDSWEWHPYRNSYVEIDGETMPSVPGGAHWGGGMFISSEDHARMGLMMLADGCWKDRRILPEGWVAASTTPCPQNPRYGYLWWLNTGRALYPNAPESSFFAVGAGSNIVWMDAEHDLVVVVRWIDNTKFDEFAGRVMESLG